ncbi:MAG: hypothetical protein H6720_01020 [Sandaracinus sp.]|nr:hypothetical protein [Sandaracinus sp.]
MLDRLCSERGFCLPPAAHAALLDAPPSTAGALTDAILRGEGFDPENTESHIRRMVSELVDAAFEQAFEQAVERTLHAHALEEHERRTEVTSPDDAATSADSRRRR